MDSTKIKKDFASIKASKDLLNLLNKVKKSELGDKYHPFSFDQLFYYCNPKREDVIRYRTFRIPKKSGGKRKISSPVRGLKSIQITLNKIFQAVYEPTKYAMGFTPKRSVVTNAQLHVGQRYIYNTDIKDFFSSINRSRVWKRLTLKPFCLPSNIADMVAGICTMRDIDQDGNVCYILPQGAPTSPIITNMICDTLDIQLSRLAKKFSLRYSRYADDITFSSMHFVYGKNGRFVRELRDIITSYGFELNESKTRLQYLGIHQEVTGLVVSDKINVSKQYVRELKLLIHIWQKYGYLHALNSYTAKHGHNGDSVVNLESIIEGKLNYIRMVKGVNDAVYLKLQSAYNKVRYKNVTVLKHKFESVRPTITINATYTRLEIEEKFSARFTMRIERDRFCAYIEINGNEYPVTISYNIPTPVLHKLMHCNGSDSIWKYYRISICKNEVGAFILLHNHTHKYNPVVDLECGDTDNIDIDTALQILEMQIQGLDLSALFASDKS